MHKLITLLFLLPLLFTSCFLFKQTAEFQDTLTDPDPEWVEITLNQMTLDEKIGQLFIMSAGFPVYNETDPAYRKIRDIVNRYRVGGLIFGGGEAYQRLNFINHLQRSAKIPLFIAADFESGTGQRLSGGTEFTAMMGVGATGDVENAYKIGRITAIEARAMGFNLIFAPVVDINNNPQNPVINYRSFGEDPQMVSSYAAAFIRGTQENGVLATAKHFPGHGNSTTDSHMSLPIITNDLNSLQEIELIPFIEAIKNNVSAIMTAHIAVPRYDKPFIRPATLSPLLLTELLRNKLQYNGLIITDALGMGAIKNNYFEGNAVVKALNAGVDILLMPKNITAALIAVRTAIQNKTLTVKRIDDSVRRILYWKSILGLNKNFIVDSEILKKRLQLPIHKNISKEIAQQGITLLKNSNLPIHTESQPSIVCFAFSSAAKSKMPNNKFIAELSKEISTIKSFPVDERYSVSDYENYMSNADSADIIINTFHLPLNFDGRRNKFSPWQEILLDSLLIKNIPVINIIFGSPYFALKHPKMKNLLLAYKDNAICQSTAADAITGINPISGSLPVTLPGFGKRSEGHKISAYAMQLEEVDPRAFVKHPQYFDSLAAFLESSIADSAFPGCAIAVGYGGKLLFQKGFGKFIYDPRSKNVQPNSIFDLASVTKVVSTTTSAMILSDREMLNLDWKVSDVIPAFSGKDKDQVTIRHLLTHSSGLPGWIKFYLNFKGKDRIVQEICNTDLIYQPGTKTVYSDLGMILMQNIIETITQKPLDIFFMENIALPLAMSRTMYTPEKKYFNDIVPTEFSEFHKVLIRGFVHDENTWAMGGVSGHAGLFSTAEDLSHFCQMYLNGGLYRHQRILKKETIDMFTQRQNLVEGSDRALGWDTRSAERSSSGEFMSMSAFGHTGFTGTSIWIDPENKVFVVLLTNRVHPTRENHKISKVRPKVHNYVMTAIFD